MGRLLLAEFTGFAQRAKHSSSVACWQCASVRVTPLYEEADCGCAGVQRALQCRGRRSVAYIARLQLRLDDLAHGVAWQYLSEDDTAWQLVARQFAVAESQHILG